jgi:Protein of unknown function (DUF1440)
MQKPLLRYTFSASNIYGVNMRKNHPSVLRGIVTGIVAGITATLIMDQFQSLTAAGQKATEKKIKLAHGEPLSQIEHEQEQNEKQAAEQEGSTEKLARKIAQATGSQIADTDKKKAGQAVHYIFGTLMGVVYSVSAELLPEVTTGAGTAFGTILFLGVDEVAVPAFQLAPPPTDAAPTDHLQNWAAHIVYGGSLELLRSLVRRVL